MFDFSNSMCSLTDNYNYHTDRDILLNDNTSEIDQHSLTVIPSSLDKFEMPDILEKNIDNHVDDAEFTDVTFSSLLESDKNDLFNMLYKPYNDEITQGDYIDETINEYTDSFMEIETAKLSNDMDKYIPNSTDFVWNKCRKQYIKNNPTCMADRLWIISKCWNLSHELICDYMVNDVEVYQSLINCQYFKDSPVKFDIPEGLIPCIPDGCNFDLLSDNNAWVIDNIYLTNPRIKDTTIASNSVNKNGNDYIYKGMHNYNILTDDDLHKYPDHYYFVSTSRNKWKLSLIKRLTRNGMPVTLKVMFMMDNKKIRHQKRVNALMHWSKFEIEKITRNKNHVLHKYIQL